MSRLIKIAAPFFVSLIIVSCAYWVRVLFLDSLGNTNQFITYYPAMILCALMGGLFYGLWAIGFTVAYWLIWIQAASPLFLFSFSNGLSISIFCITSLVISIICELSQRNKQKLKQKNNEIIGMKENLEVQVKARTHELHRAQEIAKIGNWTWHINTGELDWSDQMFVIFGVDKDTFSGKLSDVMLQAVHPDDRGKVDEVNRLVLEKGETSPLEYRVLWLDGSIHYVWAEAGELIFDDKGKPKDLKGIVQDVTDRHLNQQAIADEKERLAVTLRSIGDGVITTDIMGRVVLMNKVAENLTGWVQDDAQGFLLSEVFNIVNEFSRQPCANPVESVLKSGKVVELANHTVLISKDGSERILADSGAPIRDAFGRIIGVVLVFRDMTEKQKLLDYLQQNDKLESLGVLAGGIAHDFNNLLGGLFGFIELTRLNAKKPDKVEAYLEKSLGVFHRAKNLTQQLLIFSKGGIPQLKTLSVAKIIEESVPFALSGSNVDWKLNLASDLAPCDCDGGQIAQLIDNLTINAKQAMPTGGILTIAAKNVELNLSNSPYLPNGRYLQIDFSDTGVGITPEILPRIFDPFFTTKKQGNGLGLAMVYTIAKRHDGGVTVKSELGKGSVFSVFLPASVLTVEAEKIADFETIKGQGKILVMDDEPFILEIVSETLESLGYEVELSKDGQEACSKFKKALDEKKPFSAVILDLTIPGGIGGREVVQNLISLDPHVVAIASSGYNDDPIMSNPKAYGFTDKLSKPYRMEDLAKILEGHQKIVKP